MCFVENYRQVSGTAIAIKDLARNYPITGPSLARLDRHRKVGRLDSHEIERQTERERERERRIASGEKETEEGMKAGFERTPSASR